MKGGVTFRREEIKVLLGDKGQKLDYLLSSHKSALHKNRLEEVGGKMQGEEEYHQQR